jgi:PKD repeat protein
MVREWQVIICGGHLERPRTDKRGVYGERGRCEDPLHHVAILQLSDTDNQRQCKNMKMNQALWIAGLLAVALAGECRASLNGSDDFNDNIKDPARWGPDLVQGVGSLTERNGRLEFTTTGLATPSTLVGRPWVLNYGSYTQDWAVQIDASLPELGFPETTIGLSVNAGTNADFNNRCAVQLFDSDSEGRSFLMKFRANGGSDEREAQQATASTFAALRIAFDASTKVLSTYYDEDGPANGYSWTLLGSTNVAAWNIAPTDVFGVWIFARVQDGSVASADNVFADNFYASSGPAATWEGSDDFSSGISATRWTIQQMSQGQMTVAGANGHASFLVPVSTTDEQNAYIAWNGTPTAAEDWTVDMVGHNSATHSGQGGSALQLAVVKTASLNSVLEGYEVGRDNSPDYGSICGTAHWYGGGTTGRASVNSAAADFGLRLVYHAATGQIEAWYDPTATGTAWTKLDTISLADFSPSMTSTDTFTFAIVSDTYYGPVSEGQIWADNFRALPALPGGPTVQFTADPTNGAAPLAVQFNCPNVDSLGNSITGWNWTFGDGAAANTQNPVHTYTSAGSFAPTLITTNSQGQAITGMGPQISVIPPPTLQFSATPTNGEPPLQVQFNSPAVDNSGNPMTSWNWNFGDGVTSASRNPSHTYTQTGIFAPTLTGTNENGLPVAGIGPQIVVSLPFTFTTNNGAITISGYTGGGGAVAIPGTVNGYPVGSIGADAFYDRTDLTVVTIPDTVTNIGNQAFEDSTNLTRVALGNGLINIGSKAFYGTGLTNVVIPTSIVRIGSGAFGDCPRLTAISVDAGNPVFSSLSGVLYDNGQTTLIQFPAGRFVDYAVPGTVTNIGDYAFSDSSLNSLSFLGDPPSVGTNVFLNDHLTLYYSTCASGWSSPFDGIPAVEQDWVTFTNLYRLGNTFYFPTADNCGHAIAWNFGLSAFDGGEARLISSNAFTVTSSGTFTLTFVGRNDLGDEVVTSPITSPYTIMVPGLVSNGPPAVPFTASPASGVPPLTVQFRCPGVDSLGHAITSWNWNFGDGATGTLQNPSHTYTTGGTFAPSLIATNNNGVLVTGNGPQVFVAPAQVPSPPIIEAVSAQGGSFMLAFAAPTGQVYTVQAAADLTSPVWTSLGSGVAIGSINEFVDAAATAPGRYYRVAVGAGGSGPVYSVNVVGYVNRLMQPGTNLVANPFEATDNTIGSLLPNCPDGTAIYDSFGRSSECYGGVWEPANLTLNPGEGAILVNPAAPFVVTFVGEVMQGRLTNSLPAQPMLKSSMAPVAGLWEFPSQEGDQVQTWDVANQTFVMHKFLNGAWTGTAPTVQPGEAFWVLVSETTNWVQDFAASEGEGFIGNTTIEFGAGPTNGAAPLTVQFNCPKVDSSGNSITGWNWNFGDGATSTLQNPAHTYSSAGDFTPTLVATNNNGFKVLGVGPQITVLRPGSSGNFTYVSNNGAITITGYIGPPGAVVIPSTINGLPVIRIGPSAFAQSELTSLTIPDSISSIGDHAFWDCAGLKSATFGSGITNVEDYAFADCANLTTAYFYGNVPNGNPTIISGDNTNNVTVYYLPGTIGWPEWSRITGVPVVPWLLPNPQILNVIPSFGVQTNGFGFTVSWATNLTVVIEASTNLANPAWIPVSTNTLTGGSFYFSDPKWTNYPGRFYRIRTP